MHFLWILSLLFSYGVSESSTKIAVEFGQNVTLNCSFAEDDIYWFIQRQSEPPVYILRSLVRTNAHALFNKQKQREFKRKYSLQTFGRLVIHNVTSSELGSYYCRGLKDPLTFSNATTLMVEEDHHSVCNVTRIEPQQPRPWPQDSLKSLTSLPFIVSCLLNCILIILLLVLAVKRCSTQKKKSTSVEPPQDSDSLHYSALDLPSPPRPSQPRNINSTCPSQPSNINSTYALIQLPARV
ncbi:uncharacterized protein LOC134071334 [Sardina pilchardus]|uniref:uncharacterized protein LOC134071334 n=1 Tax=Sardina pilchardus TaxID=27697 RepID=UPI002E153C45